ncbi:MAG: peptide deformylase [Candidatus Latescibacteria bacterium]|jgi:peptide deformylase|nr:peptide deformylase [Candidatus Latescibacterota bacterium]MBT4137347.1 peptide deformylase [Candidatus Latescibacterota bacterium]MBT5831395.1 peptide deformylase [Candidatus Latescibacterota bacterium]
MALLEIKKLGCATLRKKATPFQDVTDETRKLVQDMFETMYEAEGIGLAANQVGVTERILILDVRPHHPESESMVFINPEIIWSAGEFTGEEGCLSLPGISGEVKRPAQVRVRALGDDGEAFEMELDGMGAKALQHEVDHLDGVLVLEHFSVIKRNLLRNQLRKLQKEGKNQTLNLKYIERER